MTRRARRRGRGPELDTVALLLADGWVAFRIAQPNAADVGALKRGMVPRLIQVKSTAGGPYERFGPVDREALLREARAAGAHALLAWWPPGVADPRWIPARDWPTRQPALFPAD